MDGFSFPVEVIKTQRKRSASIEIDDGTVKVLVPSSLSDARIQSLISDRRGLIEKKLHHQQQITKPKLKEYVNGESFAYLGKNYRLKRLLGQSGDAKLKHGYIQIPIPENALDGDIEASVRSSLEAWYRAHATSKLKEKTLRYASILGVKPNSVSIKDYKARWGSCSLSGDISYNWRIIMAPHHIVDYVVVHELCHLLEHNHSARYWRLVGNVIRDYKECREWLKVNGFKLSI